MVKKFKSLFIVNGAIFAVVMAIFFLAFDTFWDIAKANGVFSDFKEVCTFTMSENPYSEYHVSYAPLVLLFLYPFAMIANVSTGNDAILLSNSDYMFSFILFNVTLFIITGILTFFLIKKRKAFWYLFLGVITGAPFVFCIIRGNTVMMSLVFILIFMLFKDSESWVLQEISLIALAVAGVLKIYPLFFGVYLLNKKKYAKSIRVGIYFVLLFILPFLFFDGGLSNLDIYFENIFRFAYLEDRGYGYSNMSVSSIIYKLLKFIGFEKMSAVLSFTASIIIFIFSTAVAVRTDSDVSRSLVVLYTICLVPPVSYFYALVFMLPVFIEIANGYDESKEIYMVFLATVSFLPLISFSIFMYHAIFLIVGLIYEIFAHNKKEKISNGGSYESSNIRRRIRNKNK